MKIIISAFCGLLFVLIAVNTTVGQTTIKARTESGKEVLLLPDGTWKYASESAPAHSSVATKPAGSKTLFKFTQGGFAIWYDETKWVKQTQPDDSAPLQFRFKRGDGYAVVLVEELNIPLATLKQVAIENAKRAAPDAQVVFEETRTVNGKEVLCMKFDGTVKGIPFRYYGYYYGGKQGTIQLLTFTGQDLFAKYEQEFSDFLNGLEIY